MAQTLLEQLASPENLLAAWRAVRGNIPLKRRERAAGLDGVTLVEYERDLQANLAALRDQLLTGRYTPAPAARIEIPKGDGSRRLIGVLTVTDRVAQRAAHQVIEPLFEPLFLDCSFGYRPQRGVAGAVNRVVALRRQRLGWVVDGDIADCFGSLDHNVLLGLLRWRVKDGRVLALVQKWLAAGALPAGLPSDADDLPPNWWQMVKRGVQTGFDWMLEDLGGPAAPPVYPAYLDYPAEPTAPDGAGWPLPAPAPEPADARAALLKRAAVSGIALGLSAVRSGAGPAVKAARTILSSPQARQALPRVAGGVVGVAALAGAGALALRRRAAAQGGAGTLQGSPLSPLLANVYLHTFDGWMTQRKYHLVRYADDWLILCPTPEAAEAAYKDAEYCLSRLRLRLNPVKTRLVAPGEAFVFLGVPIRGVGGVR